MLCFPLSVRRRSMRNLVGTASLVGPGVVRNGAVAMVRSNATITVPGLRQAAFYIDS